MAAGPFLLTHAGLLNWLNRSINLAGTIRAVLVDNAHTPDLETDATYAAISPNECDDADYSPQTMAGIALTRAGGVVKLDANAVPFGNPVTIAARYIYVVHQVGGALAGTDLVLGYMDLNFGGSENVSSTNAEFTADWNEADGLVLLQQQV